MSVGFNEGRALLVVGEISGVGGGLWQLEVDKEGLRDLLPSSSLSPSPLIHFTSLIHLSLVSHKWILFVLLLFLNINLST